ncbi:YfcE family phosphodiesterase [Lactobacillus sp. CBA3606]|uniref:metallophosphoesterase family protein n=1 Tax=Lactobacillus sp. CBA3606 TaxID=2099789 RepID=UPI000CFB9899|nr:metallophosphoesterase [Lactobacillus sp. CBA3606]AVK63317.1 YfcE family phosphodiesterase [Lactobacillus sp. CBA3606]
MKCLVVSDSHGDRDILVQLLAAYQDKVDAFFHCGDSELAADDAVFDQMHVVQGNMDFDNQYPTAVTTTVAGVKVYMTHGHLVGVNLSLDHLIAAAQAANAQLAFLGHTHQLGVERHAGLLVLNPGSISYPRGEFTQLGGTYAIVDVQAAAIEVQYYDRQQRPVKALKFHFAR